MNRNRLLALAVVAFAGTVAVLVLRAGTSERSLRSAASVIALADREREASLPSSRRDAHSVAARRSPDEERRLQERFVLMMRELYGDRISQTGAQIQLAQLRIQVMTMFPIDGAERFEAIVREAFPGYADQIMATLGKVDDYDKWLSENEEALADLDPAERDESAIAKLEEFFGKEAADEILAEREARRGRDEAMHETMRVLEESSDTTVEQKLDVYRDALETNYGGGAEVAALANPGLLAQAFFGLESVSRQLEAMDPAERQRAINEIRRQLGFSEEEIAGLEEIDADRNARWETGLAYMNERRALESNFSGADLERQLVGLRDRYFGHEARTIELEERDGFFRFERPRRYGRN